MKRQGLAPEKIDSAEVARKLSILVQGIALRAVFDPDDRPVDRQYDLLWCECDLRFERHAEQGE
jgi:hypothetical protein